MLGFAIQAGGETHGTSGLLSPALFIVGCALIGGLLVRVTALVVARLRARRTERRRIVAAASAEHRARAVMSELCPHGWQATIQVSAPTPSGGAVVLSWWELGPDGAEPAVTRSVWADTIGEALEAMIAERRTDLTLEQIELRAAADGISWPEA